MVRHVLCMEKTISSITGANDGIVLKTEEIQIRDE